MLTRTRSKTIRVMLTTFRDGLQSSFGGKVRLEDFVGAMKEAAEEVGVRHFEFGGGARFQAPFFYVNENPFQTMMRMREAVGPAADLQILTRSVSGVTLTTQNIASLRMQSRLMKKYGTTWDRNFDYMNDVGNLVSTGRPIVEAGMHHQACVALMGLPFESDTVHTAGFYVDIGRRLLESDVRIDSLCLKDASGTTDPNTLFQTCVMLKKIMPPEMPLWVHTHDTASMGVACYMAAIEAGADGIDLAVRPMASGTVQPDVRSMAHALKGTGYRLDLDAGRVHRIEEMLTESLSAYDFNPVTTTADARVIGFPMPGGAIGPNVHMMVKAGLLHRYGEILEEFPVVVRAGGAWSSVTPGSQQYWLQAFNNVLMGRWKRIDAGYGRSVLGYFGRPPMAPDPQVVAIASEQLGLPPFEGDPLDAAPDAIAEAVAALKAGSIEVTDENVFLVVSAMVPGKRMEANEGIRFLKGQGKLDLPLKKNEAAAPKYFLESPVTTQCAVVEGSKTRRFIVTIEASEPQGKTAKTTQDGGPGGGEETAVHSTFAGSVEVVDVLVKAGDEVKKGQALVCVEAMKAKYDIKSPVSGTLTRVNVKIGDEVDASRPVAHVRAGG